MNEHLKTFFKTRGLSIFYKCCFFLITELLKIMKLTNLKFYFLLSYKNTEPGDDQKQDLKWEELLQNST